MVCQCGGTGKGIKSKVGGELKLSLQALFTYLCDLSAFECAISPLILLFSTSTTHTKAFAMVFTLHKFKHYLLGNKFVFCVNHKALVYLVNKPWVSRRITRWLLLSVEYDFTVVYKLGRIHVVDALSRLPDIIEPTSVPNQTINVSLFYWKQLENQVRNETFKVHEMKQLY